MAEDFTTETAEHFSQAAAPTPPKVAVSVALDADVIAWFQDQAAQGGVDWQTDINGVLRFYMDSIKSLMLQPALEPLADGQDADREAERQALIDRHQWEYETVHNGSGLSEEFPSELDARHAREWEDFERRYPQPARRDPAP